MPSLSAYHLTWVSLTLDVGVSLQGCSSKAQQLLLTSGCGVAPLGCSCVIAVTAPASSGHHQMVNTKIRLIIIFIAKDGEALYSQQKQDWELTVAQIMNSLLSNSDLN